MDYLDYSITTLQIELHKLEEHIRKLELLAEVKPDLKEIIGDSETRTVQKIGDLHSAIKLLKGAK